MNKSLPQILTAEQARQLIQRYFDAETSEQEEAALKQFIASPEEADAQFNEVRAVMGVAICDALVFPKTNLPDRTIRLATRRKRFTLTNRHVWQRAAAICIPLLLAGGIALTGYIHQQNNRCVAYIHGKKVTNTSQVEQAMHEALTDISRPHDAPGIEEQMSQMFCPTE